MTSTRLRTMLRALRKRLAIWWNRLYLYPPPEPLPRTRSFWVATLLVTLAVVLFCSFFIFYLLLRQDAFMTNAEDLGIMDQAVWSIAHSSLPHQTICDVVSDTNCHGLQGISRFAIHFEPILFLLALLYLFWATPKTLLVLQTLVVASGAFPAFWLARLRLRNEWVAVGFALLYLLHPLQNLAVLDDFHAVTFTSALLLFVLYFMYTRQTLWLFVFAVLAMACKEEIPLLVALYALWSMVFQRRWRVNLALLLLACCWLALEFLVIHLAGGPLLASRYGQLGASPLAMLGNILLHPLTMLQQYVLEPHHFFYLRQVLAPTGYLPLLAPWVLVLATPTLALNLLSSKPDMYSGLYQYNAEMVPVLIFATMEAIVLLTWLAQRLLASGERLLSGREGALMAGRLAGPGRPAGPTSTGAADSLRPAPAAPRRSFFRQRWAAVALLTLLVCYALVTTLRADDARGTMPFSGGFKWPLSTAHTQLAQRFIALIPPSASVSAQSALLPHLSHRSHIYLFPYADDVADYIFLDVTSDMYPLFLSSYTSEVKKVLWSGHYGVLAAQDGYLLLKRGLPAPGIAPYSPVPSGPGAVPDLPAAFCSFEQASPDQVEHPLQGTFNDLASGRPLVDLVGYSTSLPATVNSGTYLQFSFYFAARSAPLPALNVLLLLVDSQGHEHLLTNEFLGFGLCPTTTWQPGRLVFLKTLAFTIGGGVTPGLAHISIALVPEDNTGSTMMNIEARLPVKVKRASGAVKVLPGVKLLQLTTVIVH